MTLARLVAAGRVRMAVVWLAMIRVVVALVICRWKVMAGVVVSGVAGIVVIRRRRGSRCSARLMRCLIRCRL